MMDHHSSNNPSQGPLSHSLSIHLKEIRARLPRVMERDRYALSKRLKSILRKGRKSGHDRDTLLRLQTLRKRIDTSILEKERRIERLPSVTFPENLPITAKKDAIIRAIGENQVVIVSGDTGSGKSTQIPKMCLKAGRGINGKIACTQPRRIAATTLSRRIAEELGEETGRSVGYKVRFREETSPNGYIKIMTDGMLLSETRGDPFLNEYDTIIVDEAHERSLNIDFILGILKTLLKKRAGSSVSPG